MDHANLNATFDHDDNFDRKCYVQRAMEWVDAYQTTKSGYALAIDAPWGIGKTTLLRMWHFGIRRSHPDFQQQNSGVKADFSVAKREVVYYNAWEYDRAEDPLAPLIWTILSTLSLEKYADQTKKIDGDALYDALTALAQVTSLLNPENIAFQLIPFAMKGLRSLSAALKSVNETPLNKVVSIVKEQKQLQAQLRKALSDLGRACGQLFIMVDELDRCTPSFAIETLETVYHYFDIPNIVFVFAVDMTQLCHAIEGRYGADFDAGGYMNKYFNRVLRLPAPTAGQMINYASNGVMCGPRTREEIELIFAACGITPREIPQLYEDISVMFSPMSLERWSENQRPAIAIFALVLLCMKRHMPESYKSLLRGERDSIIQNLLQTPLIRQVLDPLIPYMAQPIHECLIWCVPIYTECKNRVMKTMKDNEVGAVIMYQLIELRKAQEDITFGALLTHLFEVY